MPEYVLEILRRLTDAGFSAYAVGGCVRDTLMGRPPHDWDVATSASCVQVAALFEKTVPTGLPYGTVTVLLPGGQAEVTTFRRDGAYRNGRRPESVEFVSDLREDLSRRDFTVNAMAMDARGQIVDLFGGREDLARGVLRCVGEPERRFSEDALRMLRAVRFSAQLGFAVDPATLAALRRLAPLAEKLSAERVLAELQKTLLSPRPEAAALMIEYGLLGRFMTENSKIDAGVLPGTPAELRTAVFALLARAAGGTEDAAELLRALRAPAREAKLAGEAWTVYQGLAEEPGDGEILHALVGHDLRPVLAACAARGVYQKAAALAEAHRYVRPRELAVKGSDLAALGLEREAIARALLALALAVTDGEIPNTKPALTEYAERELLLPKCPHSTLLTDHS